jgi:hypothetical protein
LPGLRPSDQAYHDWLACHLIAGLSLARSEMDYHGFRGLFAAPDAIWNSDAA